MNDPSQKQGNHTWDVIIDYVQCASCAYIFENRGKYIKQSSGYVKELTCPRCKQYFTVNRQRPPGWSALFLD